MGNGAAAAEDRELCRHVGGPAHEDFSGSCCLCVSEQRQNFMRGREGASILLIKSSMSVLP